MELVSDKFFNTRQNKNGNERINIRNENKDRNNRGWQLEPLARATDEEHQFNYKTQNNWQHHPLDPSIRQILKNPKRNNRNEPVVPQVSRNENTVKHNSDSLKRHVQFDDRTLVNYV